MMRLLQVEWSSKSGPGNKWQTPQTFVAHIRARSNAGVCPPSTAKPGSSETESQTAIRHALLVHFGMSKLYPNFFVRPSNLFQVLFFRIRLWPPHLRPLPANALTR